MNLKSGIVMLLGVAAATLGTADDIKLNVTYVCNGERLYVENCNIRDVSDTSTCMVAHPDRPPHNGLMVYTYETRGNLKKLFPTCKQPTPEEIAREEAFKKKQQEIYDANVRKANPQANAPANNQPNRGGGQNPGTAGVTPPKNAEERQLRRCVSSGRVVATCTGNTLLGAFSNMIGQYLPQVTAKDKAIGPVMAGVFEGPGKWRLDFIDGGVLVNCSFLSPNEETYSIDLKSNHPGIIINTTPKPLVVTLKADGTMTAPGPVVIDGVVASGYHSDRPSNAQYRATTNLTYHAS